jgi:hypothetical protein
MKFDRLFRLFRLFRRRLPPGAERGGDACIKLGATHKKLATRTT